MTSVKLNGVTTTSCTVDPATRFTSSYDANGNSLSVMGATLTYDEANRVKSASPTSGGTAYYGYAPDNKRIYSAVPGYSSMLEGWTFFGAYGERLGDFRWLDWAGTGDCGYSGCALVPSEWNVWFAGRLIYQSVGPGQVTGSGAEYYDGATEPDQVGTNRAYGARYYPYGQSSLALPGWNTATYYSTVTIPAGTAIQIGAAAGNFGQIGGGLQIYLLQAPDASWFSEPIMIGQ